MIYLHLKVPKKNGIPRLQEGDLHSYISKISWLLLACKFQKACLEQAVLQGSTLEKKEKEKKDEKSMVSL